jgi:luciferase family oxidoreductase group 1
LSVLDIQHPGHMPRLVPVLDALGFRRYWASEHHSASQSASPTVVMAVAAGLSHSLRVGSAGVLLRYASALRVAQDFAVLEGFYPGRIDLGVAGARVGAAYERAFATDVLLADGDEYANRVRHLAALVRGEGQGEGAPRLPYGPSRPELWLCGTSTGSGLLAAALGFRYAYHHFLGAQKTRDNTACTEATTAYREHFVPSAELSEPYVAVAVYGAWGETAPEAHAQWQGRYRNAEKAPLPSFAGDGSQCCDQLFELGAAYGADELVIDCWESSSIDMRLAGLSAIAGQWMPDRRGVGVPVIAGV